MDKGVLQNIDLDMNNITGPKLKPEQKRIDYILIYDNKSSKDEEDPEKRKSLEEKESKRERFTNAMKLEGFLLQEMTIKKNVFVKIHCPFKRLCAEAEMVKLEMPLRGASRLTYIIHKMKHHIMVLL